MTSNLPAPVAAQALIQAVTALRSATYLAVISLCLLLYDCAITMNQEVRFVWSQRWSFGKIVYIFIRYATVLMMAGHVASMFLFRPSVPVAILIAGSSVLIVRTWLLWGGSRWILAALIGGLVLASVLSIYYVYLDEKKSSIVHGVDPHLLPGCVVRISSTVWRPFVFPLVYETFIIALTVTKVSSTRDRAPLVMRLFLDGTLYYVVVAAVLLFTTVGAAYTPTRALVIGSGFHTACISIGCSRLVLSLHSWAYESKRRWGPRSSQNEGNKHTSHQSPDSSSSATLSKKSVPTQPEYELTSRSVPDIESGNVKIDIAVDSNTSATALSQRQPTVADVRSMLPDIEPPSLPERMRSKGSSTRRYQRQHRPPRSSSLYPARPSFGESESREQLTHDPKPEGVELRNDKLYFGGQNPAAFDSQRKYNVI